MSKREIKVFVVDDSPTARELLTFIIQSDPSLKIIGYAENGIQAIDMLKHIKPDVITMDIIMPKMDGFETTKNILRNYPIPIIIVSSIFEKGDVKKSFQALEAGALAILEKPKGIQDPNKHLIIETIQLMSEVKIITRKHEKIKKETKPSEAILTQAPQIKHKTIEMIGIGASLGGPQALEVVLEKIPANFPIPILIVQHIAPGFIHGLIDWLQTTSNLNIKLAEDGEIPIGGTVYVAPDNFHLEVDKDKRLRLAKDPPQNGLKPSVGRMLHSMADAYGSHCAGVILTGMGRDGADDLLYMKQKGAVTIAQDENSCIVYGMPQEAARIGAVSYVLSLDQISSALINLVH